MARQYTKIDVALASALYEQHHSCGKVAGIIGATAPGVWRALRRAGVAVRTRGEALKALHADPEFRAAASARMKALHADPEFRAAASARMKALHADPEFRARNAAASSERMKALHADPEFRAASSERLRRMWSAAKAAGA